MSSSHDLSTTSIPPRVVSKAPAQFVPPHSLCLFCGKYFFGGSALGEFGESAGEKKSEVIPASPLDSFGENDFFPAKYLVTHGPESARFPPSPSPFSITWSRGRSHAFLSDKAKKKLVMAFPLFRRTFLCCSLGQTVIGEIDIERRPFPS